MFGIFYMKELSEPWILIPVSSKSVKKYQQICISVQLICISSEQERISAIVCELKRLFTNRSELNSSKLKRAETNGLRLHANNY